MILNRDSVRIFLRVFKHCSLGLTFAIGVTTVKFFFRWNSLTSMNQQTYCQFHSEPHMPEYMECTLGRSAGGRATKQ